MMYLAVLEAIRHRLEGADPQSVPALPDVYGDLASMPLDMDGSSTVQRTNAAIDRMSHVTVGRAPVPIYYFSTKGEPWHGQYPSMTFEMLDVTPRFDDTRIYHSPKYSGGAYLLPLKHSAEQVSLDGVDLGQLPRLAKRRPIEEPYDFMFEIRALADNPTTSAMLVRHIYKCFPPRHYIRVPMMDGSYRSWDMQFKSYKDLDLDMTLVARQGGVVREYSKVFTYVVEGYSDTTDETQVVNLIRSRQIELAEKD